MDFVRHSRRSGWRVSGSCITGFLAGCAVVVAAYPHRALGQQDTPQIRVSSSLILVPGSPLDRSGHFVAGLRREDFRLLVDGKPVEIARFEEITGSPPQPPTSLSSVAFPATPTNTARELSNISPATVNQSELVILLVDYLNTRVADRMELRKALLKFFSTKLQPSQQIAVYGLTYTLNLLHPFTQDSSSLTALANNLLKQKGQPPDPKIGRPLFKPGTVSSPIQLGFDDAENWFELRNARREYNIDQTLRKEDTLAAFRELAESFAGVPGKKTVIWLTGDASPLNPTLLYHNIADKSVETQDSSWWQMAKTYQALNASGMSVFPLDVRGVLNSGVLRAQGELTHSEFDQTVRGSLPEDGVIYNQLTDFRQGEANNAVLAMNTVAAETGGIVLSGSNDMDKLLGRAEELWANYYVLSFVPEVSTNEMIPKYHRIEVKVDRPGVHVMARRGYVTRPEALISSDSEIQRDLTEAALSPIDLTSLALQLNWENPDIQKDVLRLPFVVTVSGDVLSGGSQKGAAYDLSFVSFVRDQQGKASDSTAKRMRGVVPPPDVSSTQSHGLTYRGEFQAPFKNVYFGRVIVRDNVTGRMGTITMRLARQSLSAKP